MTLADSIETFIWACLLLLGIGMIKTIIQLRKVRR